MSSAAPRGRVPYIAFGLGRFELYLHPSVFLWPIWLGVLSCVLTRRLSWVMFAGACLGYLALLLLHELGHAIVAAALGAHRVQVWLGGMGGYCVSRVPPTVGIGAALLLLSAGWWMQLVLAGAALLLLDLPTGQWTPGVAVLAVVWLPVNAALLVKSMLPLGSSDGAQVLAVWRQVRAQRVSRSG